MPTECMHLDVEFFDYDTDGSSIYECKLCGAFWTEDEQ